MPNSTCSEPSIEELQEMLQRDEETLQKLHDSVNQQTKGQDDDLHEELWEMQRKVTQTKRKIKSKRREQKIYEQSQSQDDISPRSQSPPVDPAHNESQLPTSSHQPNLVVTVSTTKSHDTTGKTPEDTLLMKSSTSMSKQEPSTPDTAAKEEKCGSSSKPTLKEIASSVDAKKVKSKAPIAPAWVAQIVVTNENKEIKDSVDKTVAVPIETIHRESSKEKDEILSGTVTNEEVKLEIYQAGESDGNKRPLFFVNERPVGLIVHVLISLHSIAPLSCNKCTFLSLYLSVKNKTRTTSRIFLIICTKAGHYTERRLKMLNYERVLGKPPLRVFLKVISIFCQNYFRFLCTF